jgi:hypothetical protein
LSKKNYTGSHYTGKDNFVQNISIEVKSVAMGERLKAGGSRGRKTEGRRSRGRQCD